MRAALLEVLNDALSSVGVIVAASVIATTGFQRADTIAGLCIAAPIPPRDFGCSARPSGSHEFTPKDVDLDEVCRHLRELGHVRDVHDLHASMVGTELPVISTHAVFDD